MTNIFACSLGFRGHANPLLAIVEKLVSNNHQVTYACTNQLANDIRQANARFYEYTSIFNANFEIPKINPIAWYLIRSVTEARKVLPQLLRCAEMNPPNLVLYEGGCLAGRLLGQLLKVPTVKLCPSFASTESYSPFNEDRKELFQNSELLQIFHEEVAALNKEFPVNYELQENVTHAEKTNIVCMPKIFHPNATVFDDRFHFVGPAFTEKNTTQFNKDVRPTLYISLGTLQYNHPAFYEQCFQAFADSHWQIVMPIGDKIDKSQLNIPDNFIVEPYVDQAQVLKQAKLFVTIGGMNSVQQALYYGVPLVVAPSSGEHKITATRVDELGVGVVLQNENVTALELKNAVDHVSNSSAILHNVNKFSLQSRSAGGCAKAVEVIENKLGVGCVAPYK